MLNWLSEILFDRCETKSYLRVIYIYIRIIIIHDCNQIRAVTNTYFFKWVDIIYFGYDEFSYFHQLYYIISVLMKCAAPFVENKTFSALYSRILVFVIISKSKLNSIETFFNTMGVFLFYFLSLFPIMNWNCNEFLWKALHGDIKLQSISQ